MINLRTNIFFFFSLIIIIISCNPNNKNSLSGRLIEDDEIRQDKFLTEWNKITDSLFNNKNCHGKRFGPYLFIDSLRKKEVELIDGLFGINNVKRIGERARFPQFLDIYFSVTDSKNKKHIFRFNTTINEFVHTKSIFIEEGENEFYFDCVEFDKMYQHFRVETYFENGKVTNVNLFFM